MTTRPFRRVLAALAFTLTATAVWGQCCSAMAAASEGGTTASGAKTRQAISRLLAGEQSRQALLDAVTADPAFMEAVIGRIAETPALRAQAEKALASDADTESDTPATGRTGGTMQSPPPGAGHSAARPSSVERAQPPAAKTAAAVYTCPMHPEVTSPTPGRCPKCGMALEKKGEARSD